MEIPVQTMRRLVTGAGLALALAGCAGKNRAEPGIIPDEPATLSVENDSFNDMRIYVHQGSQRIRLGTAPGKQVSSFKLPRSVVFGATELRFEAVPIGGRGTSISERITVSPGEAIVLRIPPA